MPHNIRSTKFSGETRASFFGNSINGIQKKYVHSTRSQVFLSTSLVRAVILSITSRAGLVNVPYCTSLISFLILSSIASSFINLFISKCSSFFNIISVTSAAHFLLVSSRYLFHCLHQKSVCCGPSSISWQYQQKLSTCLSILFFVCPKDALYGHCLCNVVVASPRPFFYMIRVFSNT